MPRNPMGDIKTMNTLFPAAEFLARAAGAENPGAEHLVLAALDLPDGMALQALRAAGGDAGALRRALGVPEVSDDIEQPRGPMRSQKSLQEVFKPVVKRVRRDRSQLYSSYIMLVAIEQGDPATLQALRACGVEPAAVVDAAQAELAIL